MAVLKVPMLKTSIIIPTYNRSSELRNCVESILKQTVKPSELIVVDDGDLSGLPFEKECKDAGIRFIYFKKDKPGLTESRNEGVRLASGCIIFSLDDDVVLFPDYVEEILNVYQDDTDGIGGGVGGMIVNTKPITLSHRLRRIFDVFFLASGFGEGKVLPSGFCTSFGTTGFPIKSKKEVDFLPGCAMSFRKDIFKEFYFTEGLRDYGFGEDKYFSYAVSKKYSLFIKI